MAGSNRFATAAKISESTYQSADTVVLANGRKEADALAAAPLAALNKAPILLTEANVLKTEAENEIKRLGAKNVIIAGGNGSVSPQVEAKLVAMGLKVERIAGSNRYSTSLAIAQKVREKSTNKDQAILVNGKQSADALAVSSLAVKDTTPMVLAEPNNIPADTLKALDSGHLQDLL
ncbi:MAG: cell wall-binding repeat-containing protein [Peptostreptococcus anaerobius]